MLSSEVIAIIFAIFVPIVAIILGSFLKRLMKLKLEDMAQKVVVKSAGGEEIVIEMKEKMGEEEVNRIVEQLDSLVRRPQGSSSKTTTNSSTSSWLPEILETKKVESSSRANPKKVFVVYGQDIHNNARDAMFEFLAALGLSPMSWEEARMLTGQAAPFVEEILVAGFNNAQAVIVLLTDDSTDDLLFQAGMAFGMHPDRTILVQMESLRPSSSMLEHLSLSFNDKDEKRKELASRLILSGSAVNL